MFRFMPSLFSMLARSLAVCFQVSSQTGSERMSPLYCLHFPIEV